jgi:hypothetical protein
MRSTVTITSSMMRSDGPASPCAAQAGATLARVQPESTAATARATDVDDLMTDSPGECLFVRISNTPAETTLSIFIER